MELVLLVNLQYVNILVKKIFYVFKLIIILDNAKFHKSKDVIDNIEKSGNKIIYSLPYNPSLNPIENLFSKFKNHIKNKSPDNYEELKKTIEYIFKNKIKDEHIKNYFNYLFIQANDFINKNS